MNRLHRVKQKKRLGGFALHMIAHELSTLVEEHKIDFFKVIVWSDHAATVVVRVGVFRQRVFVE